MYICTYEVAEEHHELSFRSVSNLYVCSRFLFVFFMFSFQFDFIFLLFLSADEVAEGHHELSFRSVIYIYVCVCIYIYT